MADLKTNYVDDVLDTTKNQLRKYQQIQNDDGTVSFVDVTEYTQVGTSFGAKDINDTNAAINDVNGKLHEDDTLFNRSTLNGSIKNPKLKTGIYTIGSEAVDIPSGFDSAGILIVIRRSIYYTETAEMLYLHYIDAYGKSAHCVYFNNTWTQWI